MKRVRKGSKKSIGSDEGSSSQKRVRVGPFTAIPVAESSCHAWVYISTPTDASDGAHVVLSNLRPYYTEQDVMDALSQFGEVNWVTLKQVSGLTQDARVCFQEDVSAKKLMQARSLSLPQQGSNPIKGLSKWAAASQQRPVNPDQLNEEVKQFMKDFDARKAYEAAQANKRKVDQDGFVLVTKKKNNRGMSVDGIRVKVATSKVRKREAGKEEALYGDVLKRKAQLLELRQRFKVDKERLAKLREQRKFK